MLYKLKEFFVKKKLLSDIKYLSRNYSLKGADSKEVFFAKKIFDRLTKKEIEKISKMKNKNGENFIHLLCSNNKIPFEDLFFYIEKTGKEILYVPDNENRTPLACAFLYRENVVREIEENRKDIKLTTKNLLGHLLEEEQIAWLDDKHAVFLLSASYKKEKVLYYLYGTRPEIFQITEVMSKSSHCFASLMLSMGSHKLLEKFVIENNIKIYNEADPLATDTILLNLIVASDMKSFDKQIEILLRLKEKGFYKLENSENNCKALGRLENPEKMKSIALLGIDFTFLNDEYCYSSYLALNGNFEALTYQSKKYSSSPESDAINTIKFALNNKKEDAVIEKLLDIYFDDLGYDINAIHTNKGESLLTIIASRGYYLDEGIISALSYLGADLFSSNDNGEVVYELFPEHLQKEVSSLFIEPEIIRERNFLGEKIKVAETAPDIEIKTPKKTRL